MSPLFPARPDGWVRVKICGITRPEDAREAIRLGADALGFNFWQGSKRFLPPEDGLPWIEALGDAVPRVAVTVNPELAFVENLAAHPGIDAIQLHGEEGEDFVAMAAGLGKPLIKARTLRDAGEIEMLGRLAADYLLVDSAGAGAYGGTGTVGDWALAAEAVRAYPEKPILLAGGLGPENAAEAIRRVHPFGVDVATGVESAPGIKDREKMTALIRSVREGACGSGVELFPRL